MRSRLWAAGAAVWTGVFIVLAYVMFNPQLWYMLVVAIGGLLSMFAAIVGAERRGRTALLLAMGILVIAVVLGGLQAGPVLLPAVVACALGVRNSPANARDIVRR